MQKYSFDELSQLYKENPQKFEEVRARLIEAQIQSAPVRHRAKLRVLQIQCDSIRQTCTPLEATVKMSEMMIERLNMLVDPLNKLKEISKDL